MSRIVEITMRLLLSIAIVIGFTFVVIVGVLSVVKDLLSLTSHRPPSFFDDFPDEDPESEDEDPESEDWNRSGTSSYAVSDASGTVATDVNAH
jgi:hypothetical protein